MAETLPAYDLTDSASSPAYSTLDYTNSPAYLALSTSTSASTDILPAYTPPPADPIPLLATTARLLFAIQRFISRHHIRLRTYEALHVGVYANGAAQPTSIATLAANLDTAAAQFQTLLTSFGAEIKAGLSRDAARLVDAVAGAVGVALLGLLGKLKKGVGVGMQKVGMEETMGWTMDVGLCGSRQRERMEGFCGMLRDEGFRGLTPVAQATLISLPTGRFMVELAHVLDPSFSSHVGRRFTNFVDRRMSMGKPCKSPVCYFTTPELQLKIGYLCTCSKVAPGLRREGRRGV